MSINIDCGVTKYLIIKQIAYYKSGKTLQIQKTFTTFVLL